MMKRNKNRKVNFTCQKKRSMGKFESRIPLFITMFSFANDVFSDDNLRANTAGLYSALVPTPNSSSFPNFTSKPPPMPNTWFNPMTSTQLNQFSNPFEPNNLPPMPVQPPPIKTAQDNGKVRF